MKVVQNSIRWVAKFIAKDAKAPARKAPQFRTLDAQQLRQVSGGVGSSTDGPNKGW
jgi:hypothetical protein